MADECTAIVAYEVDAEDSERFLDSWRRAIGYLRDQPGFNSTALHKAASAKPDFRFVNISCWESEDAFRDAIQSPGYEQASKRLEAFPIHASVYEVIER